MAQRSRGGNLRLVRGHRSVTLASTTAKMRPTGDGPQAGDVIRGGVSVTALDDLAAPGPLGIVADDAVNHVAVVAVLDRVPRDRLRKRVDESAVDRSRPCWPRRSGRSACGVSVRDVSALRVRPRFAARIKMPVDLQVAAGDGSRDGRPRRLAVGKEGRGLERAIAGLIWPSAAGSRKEPAAGRAAAK